MLAEEAPVRISALVVVVIVLLTGCSSPRPENASNTAAPAPGSPPEPVEDAATEPVDPDMIERVLTPWTGDYDAMVERRYIRALVPYNLTNYFVDERGRQQGASPAVGHRVTQIRAGQQALAAPRPGQRPPDLRTESRTRQLLSRRFAAAVTG